MIEADILIKENEFINIKGKKGEKVGGEILCIKASGVTVERNQFKNCVGRLSLRGGVRHIAKDNTISGSIKENCGIVVFGNACQILNNNLDDNAKILIGSGESNCPAGKQPFGDHLPAHRAKIEGNTAGEIVINHQFCVTAPNKRNKEKRPEEVGIVGVERIYCYKVKEVDVDQVKAKNPGVKVVDKAKGNECNKIKKKDSNGETYKDRMARFKAQLS